MKRISIVKSFRRSLGDVYVHEYILTCESSLFESFAHPMANCRIVRNRIPESGGRKWMPWLWTDLDIEGLLASIGAVCVTVSSHFVYTAMNAFLNSK